MKPAPQKYRTTNWKTYNEASKLCASLLIWLDPTMNWHGQPSGKRGRNQTFSDEAIQFCLSIKCLFNLPLRQAMGMAQSMLHLAGLAWPVPDYSTVSRRQKTLQVAIGAVPTTTGLHLLVYSTRIKMLGEGEWKTKKHGTEYRRQWRKVHLGIDASTLEIRAMEVTDNSIGDALSSQCYLIRFLLKKRLPASVATTPTIRRNVTRPSRYTPRMPSSRLARTPNPGQRTTAEPMRAMTSCTRRADWAGRSKRNGAATTGAALSKPTTLLQAAGRTRHGT